MAKHMKKDKREYMEKFENDLRFMHHDYRKLENEYNDLKSRQKLEHEIEVKLKEKERLRDACEVLDKRHKAALENYNKYKNMDAELMMELDFL